MRAGRTESAVAKDEDGDEDIVRATLCGTLASVVCVSDDAAEGGQMVRDFVVSGIGDWGCAVAGVSRAAAGSGPHVWSASFIKKTLFLLYCTISTPSVGAASVHHRVSDNQILVVMVCFYRRFPRWSFSRLFVYSRTAGIVARAPQFVSAHACGPPPLVSSSF